MPRPALKPGEWGNLHFARMEDGRTQVHARWRDPQGDLRRFRILGRDEYECVRRLERDSGAKIITTRIVPDDRPDLLTDSSMLAELLDCWLLMERSSGRMTESTADRTASHIRNHIDASLGRKSLNELRVQTLDRFLLSEQRRAGEVTARRSRSILVRAFEVAVRYDLVLRNAAALTIPVRLQHRAPNALSLQDVNTLRVELQRWVRTASDEQTTARSQLQNLVELALGTGLRLGELLALRPSSVEVSSRRLTVAATCTYSSSRGLHISETPKRARQVRVLRLPEISVRAVQRALAAHPGNSTTIFADQRGGLLHPNTARAELHRFLSTAGSWSRSLESVHVREVTFQLLRRTVATQLARHGGIEMARDQLGHASSATTERAYVQRAMQVDPAIGDTLEALFAPAIDRS